MPTRSHWSVVSSSYTPSVHRPVGWAQPQPKANQSHVKALTTKPSMTRGKLEQPYYSMFSHLQHHTRVLISGNPYSRVFLKTIYLYSRNWGISILLVSRHTHGCPTRAASRLRSNTWARVKGEIHHLVTQLLKPKCRTTAKQRTNERHALANPIITHIAHTRNWDRRWWSRVFSTPRKPLPLTPKATCGMSWKRKLLLREVGRWQLSLCERPFWKYWRREKGWCSSVVDFFNEKDKTK